MTTLAEYDSKRVLKPWGSEYVVYRDKKKISITLLNITKNKTTLVIAHRLSTILNSDKIYVIDSGTAVTSGTHEELLSSSEKYKNFYEKQIQKE